MKTEYGWGNLVCAGSRWLPPAGSACSFLLNKLGGACTLPCMCARARALELILSTLEEEARMCRAQGQRHSRTSPAIQVTCFSDSSSFPLRLGAFNSLPIIHLSYSRWDRRSCLAYALNIFLINFYINKLIHVDGLCFKTNWQHYFLILFG